MAEAKRSAARVAKRVDTFVKTLRSVGVTIGENTRILDLGCGAGRLVQAGREQGFNFYGAGLQMGDAFDPADPVLVREGILREIPTTGYRLPFDDKFFDIVISEQVLEHVMDYPTTLRETHRVLKPGGTFLHLFPPRTTPIEPHVFVPLATMVRARWWLKAWALLGIRNQFQKRRRMSAAETCEDNLQYLTSHTNYLTRRELTQQFSQYFTEIRFVERADLQHSELGSKVHDLARWLPFLPPLYGALRCRAAFGRRPSSA